MQEADVARVAAEADDVDPSSARGREHRAERQRVVGVNDVIVFLADEPADETQRPRVEKAQDRAGCTVLRNACNEPCSVTVAHSR